MSTGEDEPSVEGDALLGTILAGRYRIDHLLGSGGMGAVYRAEHVHMQKAVAVKVLHREMSAFPEVVARFEREAIAAGRIAHPHVVSASDFGQLEDGSFYLALEFVEGHSLAKLVEAEGTLVPERALRIARQIAEALRAAHAVGIVHRDLKPENVMLIDHEGDRDYVKVLDFGIAKIKVEGAADQPALTQLGTVFGTPEYMSPEQARGGLVDARADLYTVGVILYEMLSGRSPFKDPDLVVVLTRHLTAEPPPLPPDLAPQIRDLVLLLLRKDANERAQTAHELIEHLDLLLGVPASGQFRRTESRTVRHSTANSGSFREALSSKSDTPTVLGQAGPTALAASAFAPSGPARPRLPSVRPLPRRSLILGACAATVAIAGMIVLVALLIGPASDPSRAASTPDRKPPAPELVVLISRAEGGDQSALSQLAARPADTRSEAEWRALGHGYAALANFTSSIDVYQRGLAADPALSKDARLVRDIQRAALDPQASDDALAFAATRLGATGVDLIYDVWDVTKSVPSQVAINRRARHYLDDDDIRGHAAPALALLLDVGKAQKDGCASVKRWLSRAANEGDARVLPLLKRFDDRRGCGFLGLGDCFACLRLSKDLANTADKCGARPAPDFER